LTSDLAVTGLQSVESIEISFQLQEAFTAALIGRKPRVYIVPLSRTALHLFNRTIPMTASTGTAAPARVYTSAFWERLWRQRASSPFFASYLCFVVAYIVYGHPAGNWISRAGSGDGKCRIAPHMGSNALSGRNTIAWADRRSGGSGNIENARHNGDEDWTS